MLYLRFILLLLLLSACQALSNNDPNVMLEQDMQNYGTEASNIRDAMQENRTEVAATIAVASTQASQYNNYNDTLRATVYAIHPDIVPTRVVVEDSQGPLPIEMYDTSSGEMKFVEVGITAQIDSKNCFIKHESFFGVGISTVYLTALALNLQAGTVVRVDWQFGNEVVHSSSWVASQSAKGQCVALALHSSDVEFSPGNWTATMYINGDAQDPVSFSIIANMQG